MKIYFDLDGTLCDTPSDANWEDSADLARRCKPRQRMLERIVELRAMGHRVGIVTARGLHCRVDTRQQLIAWLGPLGAAMPILHRPRIDFSWEHYIDDKTAALKRERADVYVGDRSEDRAAALRAGARFLWDHQFHDHGITQLREVALA